ncbi:uncharacterized protein PRCAT00004501001 [Priceomyces carsonii]|uniref:uncharacterized protein n=1 Tax=Priceomyces carsonii TaxID=28549 RepID=UPI002EDAD4C3|nr:unnamed protein product [Priceomyces carsonii]
MNGLVDDDDDAWSYSFPPSTDDLLIENGDRKPNSQTMKIDESGDSSTTSKESNTDEDKLKVTKDGIELNGSEDENRSLSSYESSTVETNNPRAFKRDQLQGMTPSSHASSLSSLQSPFLGKSMPANPHTTKEDANSIISKEAMGNGLEESLAQSSGAISSPMKQLLTNNVKNSIGLQLQPSDVTINETDEVPKTPSDSATVRRSPLNTSTPSPKIIAFRKSKRSISEDGFPSEPANKPDERYDSKLYTNEFYKDTQYRYATMKRNTDFHQLFRSLDLTDRLLDDFSCALSREILLQGRIYVSESYICFNSNLLGWVTNITIEMDEIINFERKTTAGLFPNGIMIETKDTRHNFASFLSRDVTFDFMTTVWQKSTGRKLDLNEENLSLRNSVVDNSDLSENNDSINSRKLDSYILSIDGDDDNDNDDTSSDNQPQTIDEEAVPEESEALTTVSTKILKFKEDSGYKNMGPEIHPPTELGEAFQLTDGEIDLCDEIIDGPVGVVFEILFGSSNTRFMRRFLESQKGSEISEFSKFHPMEDDPTKLERTFTYKKGLDYSIGPKSTNCEVSEVIEHLNFADYVVVHTRTRTPDVPLGNAFSVMNKYFFTWGPNSSTRLRMTFKVSWTGRSWIKSVIEKQTFAGQVANTQALLKIFNDEMKSSTYYVDGPSIVKSPDEDEEEVTPKAPMLEEKEKAEEKELTKKSAIFLSFIKSNVSAVFFFLFIIMSVIFALQLKIIASINETNSIVRAQFLVTSQLVSTVNSMTNRKGILKVDLDQKLKNSKDEQNDFWNWVNTKYKTKLNTLDKVEFLTYHINALFPKTKSKKGVSDSLEEKFSDLKKAVQGFNYEEYFGSDQKENIGALI